MIELEHNQRVLRQWSKDERVVIDGFLPRTKVDFSLVNDCKDTALTVYSYVEAGHVVADIPNALLQSYGYLRVFVRPPADDVVHEPEEKEFKIVKRDKPDDYDYSETPTVSLENKVDRYWGTENAGKSLVIGEDGYIKAGEPTSTGGGLTSESDGEGNVTITIPGMTVSDDGAGNIVIG